MQIQIRGNNVVLTSETKAEALMLTSMYLADETEPVAKKEVKKHKKHQHIKICPICGKKCRGNIGLNVHMNAHKRRGANIIPVMPA